MSVTQIEGIADRFLAGKRKRFWRSLPLFKPFEPYVRPPIVSAAQVVMPPSVEAFLIKMGYGDVADVLSFRSQWIHVIEVGELAGHVIFAQDDTGNHYAASIVSPLIYFVSRSSPEYGLMSESFVDFLEEFERRDFSLEVWTNSVDLKPYSWT